MSELSKWVNCPNECYEWSGPKTCLSCKTQYYLNLTSSGGITRKWIQKTVIVNVETNIFVSPDLEETSNEGTYSSPFRHIVKALAYANEFTAEISGSAKVNIHPLGGDHYMTRNPNHYLYMTMSKSNEISYNQ